MSEACESQKERRKKVFYLPSWVEEWEIRRDPKTRKWMVIGREAIDETAFINHNER